MRCLLAIAALTSLLGGCSVSTLEDLEGKPTENTCESNDECGSGYCDPARNICVANSGEIGTVLVRVTAPSDSGEYSLLSFLQTEDGLASGGGPLAWTVPPPAELEAEVHPPQQPTGSTCVSAYGVNESPTVPVSVRFRPTEQVFGLASPDIQAESADIAAIGESYRFKARMPPGKYDVYVEPQESALAGGACSVVPQVFRNFEVGAGKAGEPLPLYLELPSTLKVIVDWPTTATNANKTLEGWNVDILDPATGWRLSRKSTLTFRAELSEPGVSRFVADVEYSQLHDPDLAGRELVRIAPPTPEDPSLTPIAPTFVLERKAVEILKQGEAQIGHITTLPDPVAVDGYVFDSASADANYILAELSLRFVSKGLDLDDSALTPPTPGEPVYFSTETTTVDGKFAIQLLPGEYDVYAVPTSADSNVAVTKSSLTVKFDPNHNPQTGKSIVIDTTTQLQGTALGPNGDPVVGAKVRATASPSGIDPVWVALGLTPPKPLSADGIVGNDGGFAVAVHPGALDVSIRPADSTGFAWLVRPNVDVTNGIHELGTMSLPLPVLYEGTLWVDVDDVTLPNALIQAYVFLNAQGYTADRSTAKAVVQVAETRADGVGKFQLLLPSHLN